MAKRYTSRGVKMSRDEHEPEMGKMHKVMHEYKMGELMSSSGKKVKSRAQALAIGMSKSDKGKKKRRGKK